MIRVEFKYGDDNMPPQKKQKLTIGKRETSVPSTANNGQNETTTKAATLDWRETHWRRRMHFAQNHALMCDVTFELEGREIRAHKLLLALASPVFEAMFYGGMAEKGDRVVITDLTAEGFKSLLGFIYTDDISLSSMDEGFQLWVAADKYCVPHVKAECSSYFASCPLTTECVWATLQTSLFLDIDLVTNRCMEFLGDNTEDVMVMEDFTKISVESMISFLSLDYLTASELTLMRGLVQWGEARINGQAEMTLKQALEPCLKLIRFGAMTIDDFCKVLDESYKAFSDGDALAILKHLAKPHYPLPSWCCKTPWKRSRTIHEETNPTTNDASSSSGAGPSRYAKEEDRSHRVPPEVSGYSSTTTESDSSSSTSTSDSESVDSSASEIRPVPVARRRRRFKEFSSLVTKLFKERQAQSVPLQVLHKYLTKQKLSKPFTPIEIDFFLEGMTEIDQVMVADDLIFLM